MMLTEPVGATVVVHAFRIGMPRFSQMLPFQFGKQPFSFASICEASCDRS